MKRKKSNHAWTPERRKRQMATLAAKRRPINGVIDLNNDASETQRMELALHIIQTLGAPGRAYVQARLEQDDL